MTHVSTMDQVRPYPNICFFECRIFKLWMTLHDTRLWFVGYILTSLEKGSSCKTLNELRHWLYCHGKNIQLEDLPPTSSSATYHILRAFHATYMQVSCFDDKRQLLDITKFGYSDDDDWFVPTRLLVMYPDEDELVPSCTCGKCARRTCVCTAAGIPCCIYCKCRSVANIDCRNQH